LSEGDFFAIIQFGQWHYMMPPACVQGQSRRAHMNGRNNVGKFAWFGSKFAVVALILLHFAFAAPAAKASATPMVAAGSNHSLSLHSDGTVWAWGANNVGQLGVGFSGSNVDVPTMVHGLGGHNIVSIATNHDFNLALEDNGNVWAWGANFHGQLGDGTTTERDTPVLVQQIGGGGPLTGVTAIAAGDEHGLALLSDTTVVAWGKDDYGQLGDGVTGVDSYTPVAVFGLTGVSAIAASVTHSLALVGDTIWAWGDDTYGQLGDGLSGTHSDTPVQVLDVGGGGPISGVTAISAGAYDSMALMSDTTVQAWGFNGYGNLGDGLSGTPTYDSSTPVQVLAVGGGGPLTGVTAISTGIFYGMALMSDTSVVDWGYNGNCQLGDNLCYGYDSDTPVQVLDIGGDANLTGITAIAAGYGNHSLALSSTDTFAWGYGGSGQLGNGSYTSAQLPVIVSSTPYNFCLFTGGGDGTSFSDVSNWTYCNGNFPQPADGAVIPTGSFSVTQDTAPGLTVDLIYVGSGDSFDLSGNNLETGRDFVNAGTVNGGVGTLNVDGNLTNDNIFNAGSGTITVISYFENEGTFNASGTINEEYLFENDATFNDGGGTVNMTGSYSYIYGSTTFYNLTDTYAGGTLVFQQSSTQTIDTGGTLTLQGSSGDLLSLRSDTPGTQWNINPGPSNVPVLDWLDVQDSNNTGTAIAYNPDFKSSGDNTNWGFLGNVSAGLSHSLYVKPDGTVWAWGSNTDGELGNGDHVSKNSPVQVADPNNVSGFQTGKLINVIAVAAGDHFSLALKTDGTVWAWGDDTYGQLADNGSLAPATYSNVPIQVAGLSYRITAIAAGANHALALDQYQEVFAWGENNQGQLGNGTGGDLTNAHDSDVPVYITSGQAIAAGGDHSLIIQSNYYVLAWGDNTDGQLGTGGYGGNSPSPVYSDSSYYGGATAIAAGVNHSMAIISGTLYTWGDDTYGQLGDGGLVYTTCGGVTLCSDAPVAVADIAGVTTIAAGGNHSLAVLTDTTVDAWGYNSNGQLGNGTSGSPANDSDTPVVVTGLSSVASIAAGGIHSLAVKTDGTIQAWGGNTDGQLGDCSNSDSSTFVLVSLGSCGGSFTAIAAGASHSLAIKSDGTVWAWGSNTDGELGNGDHVSKNSPVEVTALIGTTITAVAAGDHFSLALDNSGHVWAWGDDTYGELGDDYILYPTTTFSNTPFEVTGLVNVTAIAAGANHAIAFDTSNQAWTWGENTQGQLGNGSGGDLSHTYDSDVPSVALTSVTAIAAGGDHSIAIYGGYIYTWGDNTDGQDGQGYTGGNFIYPVYAYVNYYIGTPTAVAAGVNHSDALNSSGNVWTWGDNTYGQLGDGSGLGGNNPNVTEVQQVGGGGPLAGVTAIAAGGNHSLALISGGTVDSWGYDSNGQLGNGTSGSPTYDSDLPVVVTGLSDVTVIAGGGIHSLAVQTDGAVQAWGGNTDGQLGDCTNTDRSTFVLVNFGVCGAGSIAAVAAGTFHSLTLKADGTVWAWGDNSYGELGDENTDPTNVPVQVHDPSDPTKYLTGVTAIAAGDYYSLALKSDGTVWAWGNNSYGLLGDGFAEGSSPVPVEVQQIGGGGPLTGVSAIAGGANHALALVGDTVVAWGSNGNGQLGDGGAESIAYDPVQVQQIGGGGNLTGVTVIAAGYLHSLAVITGGTADAWGDNTYGQLGDGGMETTAYYPIQVQQIGGGGPLTDVTAVSAGGGHSLAVISGGTADAWGDNANGQLGDGGAESYALYPIQVQQIGGGGPLTSVTAVSAGGLHSLAVISGGTVDAWGDNTYSQLGDGEAEGTAYYPIQVQQIGGGGPLTGVAAVSAAVSVVDVNYSHSLALMSDTTVDAWGDNSYGELGDGGGFSSYPVEVLLSSPFYVCVFSGGGDGHTFSQTTNWSNCNGNYPQTVNDALIPSAGSFSVVDDISTTINRLDVGSTDSFDLSTDNPDFTINTNLTNNGSIQGGSGALNVYGNFENSNAFTAGSGNMEIYYVLNYGTFTASAATISIIQWYNYGTFSAGGGTVDVFGSYAYIFGSSTFYNLTDQVSDGTLYFDYTGTQTVAGTLTLNGTSGHLLNLRSTSSPSRWHIHPEGTVTLDWLDVEDSYNDGAVIVLNADSHDSGNNVNWSFTVPGPENHTTSNQVMMSRLKVNATADVTVSFGIPPSDAPLSSELTVTFPAGFTVTSDPTSDASSGCLGTFGHTSSTAFATKTACSGGIYLGGFTVTNPATPGVYIISWVNDDPGDVAVYITSEDEVAIDGAIDPSISFDVGADTSTCDGSWSSSSYAVALGTISPSDVKYSDNDGVQHICTKLSTNAVSGAVVTVMNAHGADGLESASVPTDKIPSLGGDMGPGTARYGLCTTATSGMDTTVPVGATPTPGVFSAESCGGADATIVPFDGTGQTAWTVSGPVSNGYYQFDLNAAVSLTTRAHSDYADTLTWIATGTF
jgi:alpha-tubulin suppressor-like RCC1 family protein